MRATICLFILFGLAVSWGEAELDTTEVDRLVALLEDDNFKIRNQAQKNLTVYMETADARLWHHLANIDTSEIPETRHRLKDVLKLLDGGQKLTLLDALQQPIPNAVVTVYRRGDHPFYQQDGAVFFGRTFTDAEGVFRVPAKYLKRQAAPEALPHGMFGGGAVELKFQFEVYAPSYGAAGVRWPPVRPDRKADTVNVPLVHADSEQAGRAVWGTVKDDDGKPVRRAVVHASAVEITGLGGFNLSQGGRALTDAHGRFRLYREAERKPGKLLPLGSKVSLQVEAEGLFPVSRQVPIATPTAFVLPTPTLKRLFALEGGLDPRRGVWLKYLTDGSPGRAVLLDSSLFNEPGMIVPGRYMAGMPRSRDEEFDVLVVDADSPEVLTFKRKGSIVLRGWILDGVTNQGTEAVIFGFSGSRSEGYLIDLTDADLQAMLDAETKDLNTTDGYAKIANTKNIVCIGKSDQNGRYELAPEGTKVYGVIALAPGMLPVTTRAKPHPHKPEDARVVRLLPLCLFPAAKVRLEAVLPDGVEPKSTVKIWPEFEAVKDQTMPWFERFSISAKGAHGNRGFYPTQYAAPVGKERFFYVPANVDFRMQFEPSYNKSWGPLHFDKPVRLKPGEVHDFGRKVLTPTVPVKVRVVDPAGNPLEGVAVRPSYVREGIGTRSWLTGVLSDKQGVADLKVAPGMKGKFGVLNLAPPPNVVRGPNLIKEFLLEGPTDEVFEIRLNKDQMKFLPK